jgi:hypothetical protein
MKILKLCASFLGVFAVLFSSSACNKDEECCSYTYGGNTTTVCRDDSNWQQYYDSWSEFVEYAEAYGADCD